MDELDELNGLDELNELDELDELDGLDELYGHGQKKDNKRNELKRIGKG